jgi:hypothetical protein
VRSSSHALSSATIDAFGPTPIVRHAQAEAAVRHAAGVTNAHATQRAVEFGCDAANDEPVGEHRTSLAAVRSQNFRCSEKEKPLVPLAGSLAVTELFDELSVCAPSKTLNWLASGWLKKVSCAAVVRLSFEATSPMD